MFCPKCEKRLMPKGHFKHIIPEQKQGKQSPLPSTKHKTYHVTTEVEIQGGNLHLLSSEYACQ